ncbi:MAG: FAD-binding oxidoreductase [Chloroflexi bacterium]|nr:FAD-binding oxidoreductase [Chloroflexota bacterium]
MALATSSPVSTSVRQARPGVNLDVLRRRVAGEIITAGDEAYDGARALANLTFDRRPLAIVRAESTDDVAETVRFARGAGLPLTVRSGGHSVPGLSVVDGAVVVDLSRMKRVVIDVEQCTARVQAGATSGDIAGPAGEHGLAITTGDTSSVGMGGLATGGGIGFMARKYGLTIDNLLSARVVTSEGDTVTANPTEHPDLFWAIRGGGGNFGIVTEFELRLAPVGQVLGGALVLPATREVIRGYLEHADAAPDDLTTIANLMHAPPAPFIPEDRVGEPVLMIFAVWTGGIEEGQRAFAPFRALAEPVADAIGEMPYKDIYMFTAPQAEPHAAIVRSMFADDVSDVAIDAALAAMERATSPMDIVQYRAQGGAIAQVSSDATAFAHRTQRYFVAVLGLWMDPTEDAAPHQAWVDDLWQQVRPEGNGVYVNFLANEGEDRIREAYPAVTMARLREVKRRYDPENVFRFNQNIKP